MLPYGDDGVERTVVIDAEGVALEGTLGVPPGAAGTVLFAHGSGSGRHSSRNRYVARVLRDAGLATLLLDLLSAREEEVDAVTRHHRFDIEMLARRLAAATDWLGAEPSTAGRPVAYFGASTGGGAALVAAAARPRAVRAVVSRGGRPDLAGDALPEVGAPTLLIVGGHDEPVLDLNREAMSRMRAETTLEIVPGASHLFEEPGTLERVAELARDFLRRHLGAPAGGAG